MPTRDRSSGRAPAEHAWVWVLAMVASAALLLVIHRLFVTTSTGQRAEYVAMAAAERRFAGLQGPGLGVLTALPEIVAAGAVVVFAAVTVWRRRWLASGIAVAVFAAANLTTQLLKNVVLDRPELANGVPYLTGNSLPSGHTTFAAAAAIAVFLVVAPRWRPATAALGALFTAAVGTATFVEGWHRPADIAAASLVAVFWGLAGGYVVLRSGAEWNTPARRSAGVPRPMGDPRWDVALWVGGTAAVAGAWASYQLAGGLDALLADPPRVSGWHFVGGVLFSAGPGLLVFAALSSLFRIEAGRPVRAAR